MNEELKKFVFTIEKLEELRKKVTTISMTSGAVDQKKNRIHDTSITDSIYVTFRIIKNEEKHSYDYIAGLLQKSNLSSEKKKWLSSSVPKMAQEIDDSYDSRIKYMNSPDDIRNLSNFTAFKELESSYIMHHDRKYSPVRKLNKDHQSSEDQYFTYLDQFLNFMLPKYYHNILFHMKQFCEEVILQDEPDWK